MLDGCKRVNGDVDGGLGLGYGMAMDGILTLRSRPARLTVPETLGFSGSHCVPACQLGLATTPKLTGGHNVARGPERIDGFALRPAWTSQLESGVADAGRGEVVTAMGRPEGG